MYNRKATSANYDSTDICDMIVSETSMNLEASCDSEHGLKFTINY